MKEKFIITIESFHCADRGTQNNVSERYEVLGIKAVIAECKGIFVLHIYLGIDIIISCVKTLSQTN